MKLNTLKQIYEQALNRMRQEPEYWKGFLEYASKMYSYEFHTLASLYAQNQELTQLASYEMWNKHGYKIKQGEKSIPALASNRFGMTYMFDLSQLSQKPRVKNWYIDDTEREISMWMRNSLSISWECLMKNEQMQVKLWLEYYPCRIHQKF